MSIPGFSAEASARGGAVLAPQIFRSDCMGVIAGSVMEDRFTACMQACRSGNWKPPYSACLRTCCRQITGCPYCYIA